MVHAQNTTNLNTYSWVYDAASRITQMSSIDGSSTYSYDDTDQLTGVTQSFQPNEVYSYDLTPPIVVSQPTASSTETTEYTWDYQNRLT